MTELELFGAAIHEYRDLLTSAGVHGPKFADMNVLVERLSREHDWTQEGARAIVTLANQYGAFVLRNALAVAIALAKEDGDLGF